MIGCSSPTPQNPGIATPARGAVKVNSAQPHWDFFLAHAGRDAAVAEALYEELHTKARTYLDKRSLWLGDDWDRHLPDAQRASRITVVLISKNTEKAYYQRE